MVGQAGWLPGGAGGKKKTSPANAGDLRDRDSIPGSWKIPLEKEMAIHSSILAWRIPWTEQPGGGTLHGVTKRQQKRLSTHAGRMEQQRVGAWEDPGSNPLTAE